MSDHGPYSDPSLTGPRVYLAGMSKSTTAWRQMAPDATTPMLFLSPRTWRRASKEGRQALALILRLVIQFDGPLTRKKIIRM